MSPAPPPGGARRSGRALTRLAGCRVLVLNWRDVRHSEAGGAETYAHEIARRWVAAGCAVTWLTAREPGHPERETIDGIEIVRAGSTLGVYARTALRLARDGSRYDVILDCQNGIPFFAPVFTRGSVPVVQVVHHVHQDQFATRFSPQMARVGRLLEGPAATRAYAGRRAVAVSASTRQEMRRRLHVGGVIEVVPNGAPTPRGHGHTRAADPTVVVTTRLVPHKRVDLLLRAVAVARRAVPRLHVDIVGGGPEAASLRALSHDLGLDGVVSFRGRVPDAERDALVGRAWLTTSTSDGEGWGCVVLEAAAQGVPCLAVRAPGIRDAVIDGRTGWLVDNGLALARALPRVLGDLGDPQRAADVADACRRWASCFTWDRSAELLAGVVLSELAHRRPGRRPVPADRPGRRSHTRRTARSDMTTLARFLHDDPAGAARDLRLTDEVAVRGREVVALMRGCDEVDAYAVLDRIGARDSRVRLATRHELLAGPDLVAMADADATRSAAAR